MKGSHVLDLDVPISSASDAARLFRAHYNLEPTETLGPATRADAASPTAAVQQVILYRVRLRPSSPASAASE